jgi:Thiol:disulfide interchange protein DsbD, N-terminal
VKILIATLCSLALASGDTKPDVPKPVKGEHVSITARCDPPVVLPGGWVDVVIAYDLEPGWHATSPNSKGGQRVGLELKLHDGFALSGRPRAPRGDIVHDETFGEIEELSGRGEIRRRVHVPEQIEAGTRTLEGRMTWIVCDSARCLPPQSLSFSAAFEVSPKGEHGPVPAFDPEILRRASAELNSKRYVANVRADVERASPGEEFFAIADVAVGADLTPADVQFMRAGSASVHPVGSSWRVTRENVNLEGSGSVARFTEILPLRVDPAVNRESLKLTIAFTVPGRTKADGTSSVAIVDAQIRLVIER